MQKMSEKGIPSFEEKIKIDQRGELWLVFCFMI